MWVNRSGAQQCRPQRTDRPLDEAGVAAAVRRAADRGLTVRPVGSGWSDSPLAVTGDVQLDCSALTGVVAITEDTVRVRAGAPLAQVQATLAEQGRALATVPNGRGVTVAGAITTGTHGGGRAASLSAQVVGLRIVDGTGVLRTADHTELDALRTGLGALAVLTEVELRTVPAGIVEVHEDPVALDNDLDGRLDDHDQAALELHLPSGEGLLRWAGPVVERDPEPERGGLEALGRVVSRLGQTATAPWRSRPAARWEGVVTGAPHELMPDPQPFRGGWTEWAVPREALGTALRGLGAATAARALEVRRPVEVRTGPAETGWLHPAFGRATAWIALRSPRGEDAGPLFRLVGTVLEGMGGRPHWAGRHDWSHADVALAYPRLRDFQAVRDRLDPQRRFTGDHLEALLGP